MLVRYFVPYSAFPPPPSPSCAVGPVIMSIEEKMEADGRSIYVGNVSKRLIVSHRGYIGHIISSFLWQPLIGH